MLNRITDSTLNHLIKELTCNNILADFNVRVLSVFLVDPFQHLVLPRTKFVVGTLLHQTYRASADFTVFGFFRMHLVRYLFKDDWSLFDQQLLQQPLGTAHVDPVHKARCKWIKLRQSNERLRFLRN
jgi:hypothetical protein